MWPTNQGIKQYQYTFLDFGAECSPAKIFFVVDQLGVDFCKKEPKIQQLVHNSIYMDDFVHSYDILLEAQESTKA